MADIVRYKALIGMEGACLMKIRNWTGLIAGLYFVLASVAASVDPDLFKPLFVVEEVPSCLAFSKSVPDDVGDQWQGALDGLKKDGSWERIVSGWIPSELLMIGEAAVEFGEREQPSEWLAEDLAPSAPGRIELASEERDFLTGHPVLRVAFDVDWPPVEFCDGGGGMKGMAADYLEKMGDLLGVAFEPGEPRTWREMLVAVEKGELDFFSAISPTTRRREWMDFTDPYLSFPIVVLTNKEVAYIGEISDLAGKTVAVVDGYASHDILLEKHPDLTLLPVKDVKEGLMAVSTGEAFAFVGSMATASHVISREGLVDLKVSGKTSYAYDVAMGTRKENAVLLQILNKALASVSAREKNAIYGRWTSVTFEHATDYSLIWRVSVAALAAVLIVLLWNWRLKKEIVERKRAEKAAETANRAKSTFLASMSHELRTPLNTVLGFTNIVAKSDNLSAEDRENLAIVRRSGEHLLTLINDILDLSRIEAGKVGLNEEVFDLHHLLDDLNLMFERNTRKKGLRLEFVRKPNLPRRIKADQVKLRQVLINLIGNALKFTRQGGVTITVDFQGPAAQNELKTGGGRVSFAIEDTGPGIAEAEFEKIFNPFMQTETGRRLNQGAGLGLSISRRFVRAMGGDISVESAVGKGSVFRFRIELREPSDIEHSIEIESPPAVGPAPDPPGCRILIVDDVSVNRFLLVSILGPGDFEVREAEDGRQAVEIWRRWRPRLIWMDIRMPVLDGYEATRIIREEERNSEEGLVPTVIVAVSAGVFEEQRDKALKAGCDDFVPKPLDDSVVFDKMRKLLGIERDRENRVDERHDCEKHVQKDHGRRKESRPDVGGGPAGGGAELARGALDGLPADWLETLRRGARRADIVLIAEVVAQIRKRDAATADALGRLADDFRYDEILALLPGTDRKTPD